MPKYSSTSHAPEHTSRPRNWQGVESGMAEAVRLLQADKLYHAEEVMRQVLEFAPMEGQAWHLLGRILQRASRHTEALECFASAEACYERHTPGPRQPPASIRLARLLWNQNECEQARAMLEILLMHDPENKTLQQLRAAWSRQGGQGA